jgi:predicted RNA-binding Zn ribbon-like protein
VLFAHDTENALQAAAALINTLDGTDDQLASPEALDAFVAEWRWTGSRRHDEAELAAVRSLRSRLRHLWERDADQVAELVNSLLRESKALPQLQRHDGWPYHLHATSPDQPLADRMAVDAAMAVVDVVRQDELDRLQVCAADDCNAVLVDLSKNKSRRYCSATCANRVNVAAYRHRKTSSARALGAVPSSKEPDRG